MKTKLTIRNVEAVTPTDKDQILWDTDLSGFGCKITPKGKRAYFLYYRTADGEQRRPTIGLHSSLKPEAARAIAKRWLAEVAEGGDPSRSRQNARIAPDVATLCSRYMAEHAETRKKASSIKNDQRLIDSHIIPSLGSKKVATVIRADIARLHQSLSPTPYEANRMLALASKMFSLAERWGLRPDNTNPAKNIDRYAEAKRERYLSHEELANLWSVLHSDSANQKVSPSAIGAIKLLILTGRRVSEILSLEWSWIDLDAKSMRLPDTKNGRLLVSIGDAAAEILKNMKQRDRDSRFVIAGRRGNKPLVNLQKPWRIVRQMAGIEDVRLHDLRHTYASLGAGLGMSLPLLGRLLGHSQPATTNRYAHLAQDPVRLAAETIDNELLRICDVASPAKRSA